MKLVRHSYGAMSLNSQTSVSSTI